MPAIFRDTAVPEYYTRIGGVRTKAQQNLTSDVFGDLPFANIVQIATDRILGRTTAGSGDIEVLSVLPTSIDALYLLIDGSRGLSANWDAGSFSIRAASFNVDTAVGYQQNGTTILFTDATNFNTLGGINAGVSLTTALRVTAYGESALNATTSGGNNVAIGYLALTLNIDGDKNVAVGTDALRLNIGGSRNVAIGDLALQDNISGNTNVAVGASALRNNTTGVQNTAIGSSSLLTNTDGSSNFACGANALQENTSGANNVAIGVEAQIECTTGISNTSMGLRSLSKNQTGSRNVAIGYQSGQGIITKQPARNTFIGYNSGLLNEVNQNICLGYQAGDNITTGGSNVLLGYDIDAPSATLSNQMSLGNLIFSKGIDGTGTTLSTGNIGIGVVAPAGKLDVVQPSTTGARPVIRLDQADIDEDYFKFVGASDTNVDRALVDAADFTTPGAIVGWLKINIQDDQATNPIVDGDYYIPFYAAPTA